MCLKSHTNRFTCVFCFLNTNGSICVYFKDTNELACVIPRLDTNKSVRFTILTQMNPFASESVWVGKSANHDGRGQVRASQMRAVKCVPQMRISEPCGPQGGLGNAYASIRPSSVLRSKCRAQSNLGELICSFGHPRDDGRGRVVPDRESDRFVMEMCHSEVSLAYCAITAEHWAVL